MDNFQQSALRWLRDGHCLLAAERYGGASHAYGLAAERFRDDARRTCMAADLGV